MGSPSKHLAQHSWSDPCWEITGHLGSPLFNHPHGVAELGREAAERSGESADADLRADDPRLSHTLLAALLRAVDPGMLRRAARAWKQSKSPAKYCLGRGVSVPYQSSALGEEPDLETIRAT